MFKLFLSCLIWLLVRVGISNAMKMVIVLLLGNVFFPFFIFLFIYFQLIINNHCFREKMSFSIGKECFFCFSVLEFTIWFCWWWCFGFYLCVILFWVEEDGFVDVDVCLYYAFFKGHIWKSMYKVKEVVFII